MRLAARFCMLVLGIAATYPLALVGHLGVDSLFGDREFLRELLYGYNRILAARLVNGWVQSLIWVISIWIVLYAVRRVLPSLNAWFALGTVALTAGLVLGTTLPPLIAWLIAAAAVLHGLYTFLAVRRHTAFAR
jgi:hypothetical protein